MKKFPFIECPRVFKRLHEPIGEIEQEPNENEEKIKVSFGDQLVMMGTAFVVIVIPCVLVEHVDIWFDLITKNPFCEHRTDFL